MAMKHTNSLWMEAEPQLVKQIAREICARHGNEIFGREAVTEQFLEDRWRSFELEARDAIAMVRAFDASGGDTTNLTFVDPPFSDPPPVDGKETLDAATKEIG